jgi:dCTP deaminase
MILTGGRLIHAAETALEPEPEHSDYGPVSVDVHLDEPNTVLVESGEHWVTPARERIDMPNDVAALLTGRSTHMRDGLFMPAGWVDPGYTGELKLEFGNTSDGAAILESGEPAARLVFFELRGEVDGYDGKYGEN